MSSSFPPYIRSKESEEKREKKFVKTHACAVIIMPGKSLSLSLDGYKVYIDGNFAITRPKDRKPYNGEFVWLTPGEHRIVARESEVKEVDRLESNTIWFTTSSDATLRFELNKIDERLEISFTCDDGRE